MEIFKFLKPRLRLAAILILFVGPYFVLEIIPPYFLGAPNGEQYFRYTLGWDPLPIWYVALTLFYLIILIPSYELNIFVDSLIRPPSDYVLFPLEPYSSLILLTIYAYLIDFIINKVVEVKVTK